jgi:glycerol transport system ATP-binding protein
MVDVWLQNVSHSYDNGKTWAVSDIDIKFDSGKTYALLGPSGCGKTTLLKIISGLIKPTKGKVYLNNIDVTGLGPEKRNIAIVFQFPVVYKMSVLENLLFPLMNSKLAKDEKIKRAKEIASNLGIENSLNYPAQKLGLADKQKVAIGRALIRDADVILLDEPLSSIEPEKKYEIKKLLINIRKKLGKTMVFVTHDQTEALTFGEKIAVLSSAGKILQFGTFEEIYYRPSHEMVAFFIGYPGMNIFDATLESGDTMKAGPFTMKISNQNLLPKLGTKFKVGIRPEHIEISTKPIDGYVSFKVSYIEDLGRGKSIVHLRRDNLTLKSIYEGEISVADYVWVRIESKRLNFFDQKGERIEL